VSRPSLPAEKVSRNRKPDLSDAREVTLAFIRTTGDTIHCSCNGWLKTHPRKKVRENAAQRHLDKKHGGAGAWL